MLEFSSLQGWTKEDSQLLTTGVREAYEHGLEFVIPTGLNELGWVW